MMRRITALLLCFLLLFPTQGMAELAGVATGTEIAEQVEIVEEETTTETNGRIEETLPLETVEDTVGSEHMQETLPLEPVEDTTGSEHIQETLPLEPIDEQTTLSKDDLVVYWNPGGSLPLELTATPSNTEETETLDLATPSNTVVGNDRADGLAPERPVKTLETALKQVDKLAEEEGVDKADITIYAMNPMEIADGRMYVLNAANIQIASWPGRAYDNDTIFYINGGQMTLMNAVLESGKEDVDPEKTELIRVGGGSLQMGKDVYVDGRIVMDYRNSKEETEWNTATDSDVATPSIASASSWTEAGESKGAFDIDGYILNTEPDEWEVLEDKSQKSTWREPIIELIDGFIGTEEGYSLEIRSDDNRDAITLAKTLYADETNEKTFAEFFYLVETADAKWNLIPTSEEKASVRDTGAEDLQRFYKSMGNMPEEEATAATAMTVKTLAATRSNSDKRVYWNPGPAFTYGGVFYPAGADSGYDGTTPSVPLKTLGAAMAKANGAMIVVMQTLNLNASDAGEFLTTQEGTAWLVKGNSPVRIPTLKVWEVNLVPFFRLGEGQTLILEDFELEGPSKDAKVVESQAVVVGGGDLIVRRGVTAKTGYIQVNATSELKNHPIQAASIENVDVSLFFSGINTNLEYRYTDVVTPTTALLPESATEEQKVAVGNALMNSYGLMSANRSVEYGGSSMFDWGLRPDEYGDDDTLNSQNLELYANHYYDAVYLDGIRGNDTSFGASCEFPVLTWEKAKKIRNEQMVISIAARRAASTASPTLTKAELDEKYPYPDKIYICGTVTIADTQNWEMEPYIDYDGTTITTEVVSHTDIKAAAGDTELVHELPGSMVKVVSNGVLTVKDVTFRNVTDLSNSQTILVDGGGLMIDGKTTMTGTRVLGVEPKEVTLGTHVAAKNAGVVLLMSSWTGSIEKRQQGVTADGSGTEVTMNGGTIQKNDAYDKSIASSSLQKKGAGVALSGGSKFVMNGGSISENKTYQFGGGVFVTGSGTTFTMNTGSVRKNTISLAGTYFSATAMGVGIYGDVNTILNIGTDTTSQGTVKVSENSAYMVTGSGIWANGHLNIKNAEISNNTGDSSINGNLSASSSYIVRGVGICVGRNGTLSMENTKVSGNKVISPSTNSSYRENGMGAGIYLESNSDNVITNSELSGNIIGFTTGGASYSAGGAIWSNGKLEITNTEIFGNRADVGAGIMSNNSLTISNSIIRENIACNIRAASEATTGTGAGGGIYQSAGSVTINDCKINNNKAGTGGGIYHNGGSMRLIGSAADKVEIKGNTGGGIYQGGSTSKRIYGENVLISQNTGSGVTVTNTTNDTVVYFRKVKINNNMGGDGAGVNQPGGTMYLEDVNIEDNTATGVGGGMYMGSSVYWSETVAGASSLRGNSANMGGGIYSSSSAASVLDFSGEIQNSASDQGSNLYQKGAGLSILQGTYKQPLTQKAGVYNVYLAIDTTNNSNGLTIDPQQVTIEKKAGAKPDAVYLHTGNSVLRYLQEPKTDVLPAAMPIDVNENVFKVGSVVIKPANITSVVSYKPNADLTGGTAYAIAYTPALLDASKQLHHATGGKLPRRTQLGGYRDEENPLLTNVVLVGEGVYLAGEASGGSDDNDGMSPDKAVKTFTKAKTVLEEQIQARKGIDDTLQEDEKLGFSPYIYICGTVPILSNETWELDYDDILYTVTNQAYRTAEKAYNPTLSDEMLQTQARRFASFLRAPMIILGDGTAGSTPNFTLNKIIIDGMAEAVLTATQGERSPVIESKTPTMLTLNGEAQIRNNYGVGIRVAGQVLLDGEENESNKQLKDIEGTAIALTSGGKLEMKGYSRIITENTRLTGGMLTRIGIDARPATSGECSIIMRDYSALERVGTATFGTGISAAGNVDIQMQDFSQIRNVTTGISLSGTGGQFSMNCDADAEEGDSAQILGATTSGIYLGGIGWKISMGKASKISTSSTGIYIYQSSSSTKGIVEMLENSAITNGGSGINIEGSNSAPIDILMKGNALIARNSNEGIREANSGYAADRLALTMEGNARISANGGAGVSLLGDSWRSTSYQKVILKDNAMIGGTSTYTSSSTDYDCGNNGHGIWTQGPTEVLLQGNSAIQYNSTGVYVRRESSSWRPTGIGSVTMEDKSSITNNRTYGIQNDDQMAMPKNELVITLKGDSVIRDNATMEILLNPYSQLYLKDTATVSSRNNMSNAITALGKVYMEGTVTVNGRIYLRTSTLPITLQTPIAAGKEYHLRLAEGFLGKEVVIPDGVRVMDATLYLNNYVKDLADGLAATKLLVADRPNIILQGENNVYLSGNGNDQNDGNSPTTAVRTFHRARELLKTGYFTEGANIFICGSAVEITNWSDSSGRGGDEDWSFDNDGTVTNQKTGAKWTPLVQRYEAYRGRLISVTGSYKVTFKNITIDGNKGKVTAAVTNIRDTGEILYLNQGGQATLEAGAVLQNNAYQGFYSTDYDDYAVGVRVHGGKLEMSGGIIQNMEARYTNNFFYEEEITGVAVLCYPYGTSYPGTFDFKSGQIRNNSINPTSNNGYTSGAAVAIKGISGIVPVFRMSGGTISENTNTSSHLVTNANYLYVRGAGVYVAGGLAEISGGTIRNNSSNIGSGIYYVETGTRVEGRGIILSGGQVSGNRVNSNLGVEPYGEHSPIYVKGVNFQLRGGGCDVGDAMYLQDTQYRIIVSGDIYQTGRKYKVSLNQGSGATQYQKGSVVVSPDGNRKTDVTAYLPYFTLISNPYVLDRGQVTRDIQYASGIVENQCLLLMQAVFLNGEKGDDSNNATTPKQAVKTFTRAKQIGQGGHGGSDVTDYYIIYICGKTTNTEEEHTWNIASPSYLCRYTGFLLYQLNGNPINEINPPYYGYLIEPLNDLTMERLAIYGRRAIDPTSNNGDSLVRIPDGVTVTIPIPEKVGEEAVFGRNYNIGEYLEEGSGISTSLSRKGGAFQVMSGGTLIMESGRIVETEATFGGAIYLEADRTNANKTGRLSLKDSPLINGSVYLGGTEGNTFAYIEPEASYVPKTPLKIAIENDYHGRDCVRYPEAMRPGKTEMEYYSFEDSIYALYDVVYRDTASNIIELNQKEAIYLDGIGGSDSNDGKTPETALRTLKKVYQHVNALQTNDAGADSGSVVYVVNTVTLDASSAQNVELNNVQKRDPATGMTYYEGYYKDRDTTEIKVDGQVYFKRYAQPKDYTASAEYAGYGKDTLLKELFVVESGGNLTLWGTYLDGHSQSATSNNVLYTADGVQAQAPLITVKTGGKLVCQYADAVENNIATSCLLLNNINTNKKTNIVGSLNGSDIYEGSSAGIELLGGEVFLNHAEFRNLKLGANVVSGGADIYHNGSNLTFYNQTLFGESIFLEGQGVAGRPETHASSKYLSVYEYGTPLQNDFQVLIRDPYKARQVVYYIPQNEGPIDTQIAVYRLEERTKEFFYLTKKASEPWVLELQVPSAVYIDGQNGDDELSNINAGSNPAHPVKTLKRAFDLLKTRAGNTIYVVGTIEVDQNMTLSGTHYQGTDGAVSLGSTEKVNFVRYIQPDFAYNGDESSAEIEKQGYHIPDFKGALLHIQGGNKLTVGNNIFMDGHSEVKVHPDYPKEVIVNRTSASMAPILDIADSATVELLSGSTLHNNNNVYETGSGGMDGGAINNRGMVTVTGAMFENNHAKKGDAAYQAGTFAIQSGITNLAGHSFYLASTNSGTEAMPNWTDYVLRIAEAIPDNQTFDIEMDHGVAGRDVIQFTDSSAYAPNSGADAEHVHFAVGSTVPIELFLVEAEDDGAVLELQDWRVLNVQVPANIYLAINRKGTFEETTKLDSIQTGTDELFSTPVYEIVNNGRYEVLVSINGVDNVGPEAGITHDTMILKSSAIDALGAQDLYLALKGKDSTGLNGFNVVETALQTGAATPFELGRLQAGNTGTLEFVGKVGVGFVDKYKDLAFPLTDSISDVQKHMNGTNTGGVVHARAKYLLKYKVELVEPRRN